MASLKATKVPEKVERSTLDPELEAWLNDGCPSLGGHMSVDEMRREHQALVPENKIDVQVGSALSLLQAKTRDCPLMLFLMQPACRAKKCRLCHNGLLACLPACLPACGFCSLSSLQSISFYLLHVHVCDVNVPSLT